MRINKNIGLISLNNDIKYKGVLSYRHLRLIAWISLACAQLQSILMVASNVSANSGTGISAIQVLSIIMYFMSGLSLPLFLISNFALIVNNPENVKRKIVEYAAIVIGIYGLFALLYYRYIVGVVGNEMAKTLEAMIPKSVFNFNVFIDMLLSSLIYFFVCYTPKKIFTGKKIVIFRLMVLLPILYEVACIVLKGLDIGLNIIDVPAAIYPLFTTKPTLTLVLFLSIVFFLKRREILYKRAHGSLDGYNDFLQTNANNLHFGIFTTGSSIIAGTIDLIAAIVICVLLAINNPEISMSALSTGLNAWGIGKASDLLVAAPIFLLFRYTKVYDKKTKDVDKLIIIFGIALIVFVYLEGGYQLIRLTLGK